MEEVVLVSFFGFIALFWLASLIWIVWRWINHKPEAPPNHAQENHRGYW